MTWQQVGLCLSDYARAPNAQTHAHRHATPSELLSVPLRHQDVPVLLIAEDIGACFAGRGWETRAITYPDPSQRITYHPHAAPLHRVRTEDMLPVKLLTPFQAENDVHIKDTYNYMTVQADIRMPHRQIAAVQDSYAMAAWRRAIEGAVAEIEGADKDCRVLNLGAGAGVHAALALRAGARHVTAVERWLYLALVCKETLEANQVPPTPLFEGLI